MHPPATIIPLPEAWPAHAKSAVIAAVGLARFGLLHVRGWAANSPLERARLRSENDRLRAEVQMLRRELEIKDRRMARIPPERRPHYLPEDRLGILALRAARGWSCAETARRFLVVDATIRLWTRRCDEDSPQALVRTPEPVNRFPECVTAIVQQLAVALPSAGKRRIADLLARAGLHLSRATVQRRLREPVVTPPRLEPSPGVPEVSTKNEPTKPRSVIANDPGHVWSADLTVAPIAGGLWAPWLPCWCVAQRWPFAWWLLLVVDQFSRAIVHVAVFRSQPSARQVCDALDEAVAVATGPPRYMVTDQGGQFGEDYRDWCASYGVRPRFGAIGKTGSIAVTERLIRTVKSEGLRRFLLPLRKAQMLDETALVARWYNEQRPHRRHDGATPDEIRTGRLPATELPRFETRRCVPVAHALRASQGASLELRVDYLEGRKHLPLVSLRRAAA